MTFVSVVPRNFMVLTPFSRVLLRLLIALLVLWFGWIVLRVDILTWSLFVWVGVSFSFLSL